MSAAATGGPLDVDVVSRRDFVDVAVVGGGPAGIAAAIAAAGCGASVLLLERDAALGGNVSQAFVHTICGLYLPSPSHTASYAHNGIARAFAEELARVGAAGEIGWAGGAGFLPIDPLRFAEVARRRCEAAGVRVALSAALSRLTADDRGWAAQIAGDSGVARFARARFVIDASGDANAAVLADIATERADAADLQHPSWIFGIDCVDGDAMDGMECARTTTAVARAARNGGVPASASSVVLRRAIQPGSMFATLGRPKPHSGSYDPLDTALLATMQADAARDAQAVVEFLVRERAPFRNARPGALPRRLGIRETRRIAGLQRLEVDDVLSGRRRDDEACVSTWPVELWSSHERMSFRPTAGPSSVPLGCLIADHPTRRLAMAGRCASASHEALGAIRVIGTAMAMGEAAGVACALAVASGLDLAAIDPANVRASIASGQTTCRF